jgi:hypothetical protein
MCMGNVFALIHKGSAVRFLHVSGSGLSTCDAQRFPARQLSSNVLPEGYLLLWQLIFLVFLPHVLSAVEMLNRTGKCSTVYSCTARIV